MPLGRTLTKRLQKFNKTVVGRKSRSNSAATSPSGLQSPSSPSVINENGDYFYSISFEQTAEGSDVESLDERSLSSLTDGSSRGEPVTPSGFSTDNARVFSGSSTGTTSTLNDNWSEKFNPVLPPSPQQFYPSPRSRTHTLNNNSIDNSSLRSSIYSNSVINSPSLTNDDSLFINDSPDADNTSFDCDNKNFLPPEELKKLEEDAKADEMAMNILEKVSADDYVREIKTGSWYI